jgi:hypothetical protein
VLRRLFKPKKDEVTGVWRKLRNEELRDLYSSPSIIRIIIVHNKIEHKKHLLRTVVLIKVLVDTRATGCITQQLSLE